MVTINWYPGHMKKTRELIQENVKLVNAVIEVLDARLPESSRNPVIDELIKEKKRILVLNKVDLADEKITNKWIKHYEAMGYYVVAMNSMKGQGMKELYKVLDGISEEINANKLRKKILRVMIVGIPNVGKSSLINRLSGKKSAKTGNKPGVTRGKQWIFLRGEIQLLDTPGILWPKFEDMEVGKRLSYVGSIKDDVVDLETIAYFFIQYLSAHYPERVKERYDIEFEDEPADEIMDMICKRRGFILSGGRMNYERAATTIMDEYRNGLLGRISIESPDDRATEEEE